MHCKKRIVGIGALFTMGAVAGLTGCGAGENAPATDSQGTPASRSVDSAPIQQNTTPPSAAQPNAAQPNAAQPNAAQPNAAQPNAAQPNASSIQANAQLQAGRIRRVYGVVATGKTPDAAAESFRQRSAAELGVDRDELTPTTTLNGSAALRNAAKTNSTASPNANANTNGVGLMYDRTTGKPKFRLYSYEQQRDGIPVFRAGLRTLVREDGENPVVWANSDLRPMGSFRARASLPAHSIDLNRSLQALSKSDTSGQPTPSALTHVSRPTPTIFAGVDGQEASPRQAVRYTAQAANGPGKWTFIADAETGDILHVESLVHFDVTGTVKGKVVASAEAAECGVFGTVPLPYAKLSSSAGDTLADKLGAFTIPQTGTAPFAISSTVTGKYFQIDDGGGSNYIKLTVTPPGPANFLHQDTSTPPERVLAQLNAYKYANDLRDQLLTYVPSYPVIAGQTNFRINVNLEDPILCPRTGGAWFDGDQEVHSINFCVRDADHANTAFRSIIHHEYGHHIIESSGSGQAEYGEGMADTIAMMFAKDPKLGVGYYLNQCSTPIRVANRTCQYDAAACSSCGGFYDCGSVLSSTVWDIWQQLDATSPSTSADIIRELVFSSILLHSGTRIDPSIAVDMLTLDDNDALLENGTPHYSQICSGFAAHGMNCPPIVNGLVVKGVDLNSEGLSAGPFAPASTTYTLYNLGPQQSLAFNVAIPATARWLTTSKTSGTIALGQSTTVTLTIDQAQAKLLSDGKYTAAVQFVNATSGVGTVSRDQKLRVGAPVPVYTANFNDGLQGFTPDGQDENLWHRSTGVCADSLAGHSTPGSLYYGKDSVCNYATPIPIYHAINSPEITIANPQTAELGFKYFLKTENNSSADSASVLISVNGGTFKVLAANNDLSAGQKLKEGSVWQDLRFDLAPFLPQTGPTKIKLQFAFNAGGIYDNLTMGFAVDDVIIYAQSQTTTLHPCAGYCTNPTVFTAASYQSGNLGTAATCHETTAILHGGTCGNFVSPRKLSVNGVAMNCNWANWASLPPAKNGGYCIYTTSGNNSWAAFTTW